MLDFYPVTLLGYKMSNMLVQELKMVSDHSNTTNDNPKGNVPLDKS